MYKIRLDHPVIPDGKAAIRDDWSHVRYWRANSRTLLLAEAETLQASVMTALSNTPNRFKSMSLQRYNKEKKKKTLIVCHWNMLIILLFLKLASKGKELSISTAFSVWIILLGNEMMEKEMFLIIDVVQLVKQWGKNDRMSLFSNHFELMNGYNITGHYVPPEWRTHDLTESDWGWDQWNTHSGSKL